MRVIPALLSFLLSLPAAAADLARVHLPPGFAIDYFAERIPDARSLTLGANGTVFVGNRKGGKVYALVDGDRNGRADKRYIIADDLDTPNGIAFLNGDLFVATHRRILRFAAIESHLAHPPRPEVIVDHLPAPTHHGWRYLAAGPDGWLYLSIGAPCNICDRGLPFAAIHRLRPDGSGMQVWAEGVRNSIGITWSPQDGAMWFTDNGRDWLGDDAPPDELNRADQAGMHFGYPYRHGHTIVDPEYGERTPDRPLTPPALELDAHVAALGLRFYTGTMFPDHYRGQLFIAEYGSWNRSDPAGYRIEVVTIDGNRATGHRTFADGWLLPDGRKWGRPVDLLVMPDGALLVSDDMQGAVYRISWHGLGQASH
jgi:glucose/arabinose dehydrogenase